MANDTIASGNTLTLSSALSSGTNIDFLNNAGDSGVLDIKASALRVTTVVSGGTASLASATIGGDIVNFQPGDQITLQNFSSFYNELDFAPNAAAQNASFANDLTFAAESGIQFFIQPDGSVSTSVQAPFTLDANSQLIIDDVRDSVFGTDASSVVLTLSLANRLNPNSNHPFIDGVLTSSTAINACFTAGTQILTTNGEIAIEALVIGDRVITVTGEEQTIIWTGQRTIDITRHPRPEAVQPIIIEPDALADGVPSRRLTLSPDHALLIDNMLVQAKDITNRTSIRQNTAATTITYHHIETTTHDVILANGTPAETYLDTGHRGIFSNATEPTILHPNLMQTRRETTSCAPLCTAGPALATIRQRLARRLTAPVRLSQ